MRCEVCGRKIHTDPISAVIEGARLTVCVECSKHGKIVYDEPKPLPARTALSKQGQRQAAPIQLHVQKRKPQATVDTTQEVVDGYAVKIREAREKLGLSHEELGKKINEKESVLRKIETGKMEPNNLLISKLEHTLKIKLLVPVSEEKVPTQQTAKASSRELTLGDLIEFGKKGREEPSGRKQS